MGEWSIEELGAAVAAYLDLLADERAGRSASKATARDQLLAGPKAGRTRGSVEYRMQNISAVLDEMGRPWVAGYKPAANVGPTNTRRLRELIETEERQRGGAVARPATPNADGRVAPRRVYVANFGRENFEWPRCLAGNYVATMQDERAHAYWADGDRDGYVRFAMSELKTARGLPPVHPVASRWYNLGTIVTKSEDDLWVHKQGDMLWWTVTTSEPARIDIEPDPSARPGEPVQGVFYRKPARPWSNMSRRGNRLDWRSLHPKAHDFFTTEATLQQLGPDYAGFAIALINGDDIGPWTEQATWRAKAVVRGGVGGTRVFNRQELSIARMARQAMDTARGSNGQEVIRRLKNKEVRFASLLEFERYLAELWCSQEGLCALSGVPPQSDPPEDLELRASLDRKDSDGHYEPGNLQIVCRFANRWKSDDDDVNFRRLLTVVRTVKDMR